MSKKVSYFRPVSLPKIFGGRKSNLIVSFALRQANVHLAVLKLGPSASNASRPMELIVNDEQPVEQQNYARAIEILLERYARLNLKHALTQVVVSQRLVAQTTVDKPALSDDEIGLALPWTLKELMEIPPSDMAADFYESPVQLAGREKIQAVAVQASWLAQILQPLHDAKLAVQGVVNEDVALCALLPADHPPTVVVSQYQTQPAQLLLVKAKGLVVSRQLKPLQSVADSSAIEPLEVDTLALEVQRSLDYFSGQLRQAPLQQARLALPTQHSVAIGEQLEQSLSLQVGALEYPEWAGELAAGDYSDLGGLAGLAYLLATAQVSTSTQVHAEVSQNKHTINLYTNALRPQTDWLSLRNVSVVVLGVLVLMVLSRAGIAWQQSSLDQQLNASQLGMSELQQQLAGLATQAREQRVDPQLESAVAELERELRALQSLSNVVLRSDSLEDDNYARLLRDLSAIHQHGLWLSHIELRQGQLILRGHTEHSGHLPRWMARFNNVPSLSGRQFAVVSLEREDSDILSFEVHSQRESE